jgi:hypothetical protein
VFVAALGFLGSLNAANPDVLIVQENLARYQAGGPLDVDYLAGLSEDATPTLVAALAHLPAATAAPLRAALRARLTQLDGDPTWRAWPAWHLARWQAYAALTGHRADLGAVPAPRAGPGGERPADRRR